VTLEENYKHFYDSPIPDPIDTFAYYPEPDGNILYRNPDDVDIPAESLKFFTKAK